MNDRAHNPVDDRVAEVVSELESLSERLNDLAMDALRTALEAGAEKRPDIEKKLSAARRSIDKAIRTLER